MIGRILFILFFVVGLLEVGAFILVGKAIGLGATLLLVLLTAIIGSVLLKKQGLATYISAKQAIDRGEVPVNHIVDGIALFVAGALLLTPGFITDAIGFALFVPSLRQRLGRKVAGLFGSVHTKSSQTNYSHQRAYEADGTVIDSEAIIIEEHNPNQNHTSRKN